MTPRLLFVTQTSYIGGGIEEWLWSLYTELESAGWDCSVGLVKGAHFHRPEEYLKTYPFKNYFEIDGSRGYVEQRHDSLAKAFTRHDPDIIICFNLADVLYAAVNWKRSCKNSVRIVYAVHSLAPQIMNDVRRCAANIDLVGCVSKRGCALLKELCGSQSPPVQHLPTGVPVPMQKTSWPDGLFVVGYVGRLDADEKRIMDLVELIRALDEHPEFRFEIAGQGPAEEELKERLRPCVDAGRVVFHGHLERDRLYREIYPRLQALLLFSPAEGGPIVAWEAMRHGVVPVVSDFAGRKEEGIIDASKNARVFPVGNTREAVIALQALRSDELEWAKLSAGAMEIPEAYHLETFGARWAAELERMLETPIRLGHDADDPFESPGRISSVIKSSRLRLLLWRLAGRRVAHMEPGGEWPHSYNGRIGQTV